MREIIWYPPIPPPPAEKRQIDKELRALRTKKISYAITGMFAFVIFTMILVSVVYLWVVGYMGAGGAGYAGAFTGELPAEPKAVSINSTINVEYRRIEKEYVPIYTLSYEATFKYIITTSEATANIPLPKGSVENLLLRINNNITEPTISGNNIVISLSSGSNTIYLSYSAKGSNEYSHQVPRNRLIERFYMKLELRNVEWHESLPEECLVPDNIIISGKTTIFIWDKDSAVLDKNIIVKLPKWENPFDTYLNSIPAFFVLILLLGLFYYEAFRRVGKLWKTEYICFLLVPFVFLYLSIGVGIVYLDLLCAAIIGLVICIVAMYLVKRKVLGISKGFSEIFLIPSFAVIFVNILSFVKIEYSLIVGASAFAITLILAIKFFKTYPRPEEKLTVEELSLKINILEEERRRLEQELAFEKEDKQKILARIKEGVFTKRFCPYCRYSVTHEFDFCPKCGKDIKRIMRCGKCGALTSTAENELYCPNCGEARVSQF
ncbi:MAG: zinc ribbon domain-containing protein [Candidatus Thermoplasmatota archaeon]|nr:zinc ribbon domain-containing protein [Candidatus Thermoplasmatota archaeon]